MFLKDFLRCEYESVPFQDGLHNFCLNCIKITTKWYFQKYLQITLPVTVLGLKEKKYRYQDLVASPRQYFEMLKLY